MMLRSGPYPQSHTHVTLPRCSTPLASLHLVQMAKFPVLIPQVSRCHQWLQSQLWVVPAIAWLYRVHHAYDKHVTPFGLLAAALGHFLAIESHTGELDHIKTEDIRRGAEILLRNCYWCPLITCPGTKTTLFGVAVCVESLNTSTLML